MDYLSGISNMVMAICAIAALYQIILAKRNFNRDQQLKRGQFIADQEIQRREKAIEAIHRWNESISPETNIALRIVRGLSDDECKKLVRCEVIRIPIKELKYYKWGFGDDGITVEGDSFVIDGHGVLTLRFQCVQIINQIEGIMSAWHNNIADREMIQAQFKVLFPISNRCDFMLINYIRCAGKDTDFPAIVAFEKWAKLQNLKTADGKPVVDEVLSKQLGGG